MVLSIPEVAWGILFLITVNGLLAFLQFNKRQLRPWTISVGWLFAIELLVAVIISISTKMDILNVFLSGGGIFRKIVNHIGKFMVKISDVGTEIASEEIID